MNLFNETMESRRRNDKVTSTFQSAGKTSTHHVHVISLRLKIYHLVWICVLRRYHFRHFVPQFCVGAVRLLSRQLSHSYIRVNTDLNTAVLIATLRRFLTNTNSSTVNGDNKFTVNVAQKTKNTKELKK